MIPRHLALIFRSKLLSTKPRPDLLTRPKTGQFTRRIMVSPGHLREEAMDSNGNDVTGSIAKRPKLSGPLIGTHSGHFHADEALAVFMLSLLPTYKESPLVRTRDQAVLNTCHTVVDVGGEYDQARNRYDHHQREFKTTFPGHTTKLSSAGLVYMHFGKAMIASQTGLDEVGEDVTVLYEKLYTDLIEAFDANDNGIPAYDTAAALSAGISKRFDDTRFSLASVVNRYNHFLGGIPDTAAATTTATKDGESKQEVSPEEKQRIEDERFQAASTFVGQQFLMELQDAHNSWLPSRAIVREAYEKRFDKHASGRIMVLPHREGGLPWSDHLYDFEQAAAAKASAVNAPPQGTTEGSRTFGPQQVLYVLFPESGLANSKWRIRSVSLTRGSFANRKDLPDAWKGLRDDVLSDISGVPGCVFVHASGFIGGNITFEGALEMAKKAVEM